MTRSPDKPDNFALIIGAMKSGTTSLFEILTQHPEVSGARTKEPDFFSNAGTYELGWDWYRDLWKWKDGHVVALEASASYTKAPLWSGVPERIAAMPNARFRFIYMVRHPITRISSQVRHALYEGWGKSLDEGMSDDLLHFTRYAMQADQYMAVFPSTSLLVVTLEEFSQAPEQVLRRICTFLGIDPEYEFASVSRRYNKGDLYGVAPLWRRLARASFLRAIADRVLPRSVRHRIRDAVTGVAPASGSIGRYELDADERERVLEALAPDLRRLRDVYGVDVEGHWGIALD